MMRSLLLSVCAFALVTFGTSASMAQSKTVSRSQLNQAFTVKYGVVSDVRRTKVKSSAGKGALYGGLASGALRGKKHRTKHAVEGAIAGAILTSILEGSRHVNEYTVDLMDGSTTKVIIEHTHIQRGDCVAVEVGPSANVRRVSRSHCEHAQTPVMQTPVVVEKQQDEAADCHAVKQELIDASTEEELNIALKKVQIICES